MKSNTLRSLPKIVLSTLGLMHWVTGHSEKFDPDIHRNCAKGITYYIQTDRSKKATVTIDMSQAYSNIYLTDIVCYYNPIDASGNRLVGAQAPPIKIDNDDDRHPAYVNYEKTTKIPDNNVAAYQATEFRCTCNIKGGKGDEVLPKFPVTSKSVDKTKTALITRTVIIPTRPGVQTPTAVVQPSYIPSQGSKADFEGTKTMPANVLSTMYFPGGGSQNNNNAIGDFCCSGETATIPDAQGIPIGFVHYSGILGSKRVNKEDNTIPKIRISFSGRADPNNSQSRRITTAIDLTGKELYTGFTKWITAGALRYKISLITNEADLENDYLSENSVKVKVEVRINSGSKG